MEMLKATTSWEEAVSLFRELGDDVDWRWAAVGTDHSFRLFGPQLSLQQQCTRPAQHLFC
jgi:hypothetical protein